MVSMASRTAYSTWTPQQPTLFDGHYLRNRSILDIDVLGYIGIVQHKEHSPEVLSLAPGTPCIYRYLSAYELQLLPNNTAVKHFDTNQSGAKSDRIFTVGAPVWR